MLECRSSVTEHHLQSPQKLDQAECGSAPGAPLGVEVEPDRRRRDADDPGNVRVCETGLADDLERVPGTKFVAQVENRSHNLELRRHWALLLSAFAVYYGCLLY